MTQVAADQFAALGAPVPADIVVDEDEDEDETEVWRENIGIVGAFFALGTQWRQTMLAAPDGVRVVVNGIDYAAAEMVLRRHGLGKGRGPLDDLRVMEAAALPVLNGGAA